MIVFDFELAFHIPSFAVPTTGLLLWRHHTGKSVLAQLKGTDFNALQVTDLQVDSLGRMFKKLCEAVDLDPKAKLMSIMRPSGAVYLSMRGLNKSLVDVWGGWGTTDSSSTVAQQFYLNKFEGSMLKVRFFCVLLRCCVVGDLSTLSCCALTSVFPPNEKQALVILAGMQTNNETAQSVYVYRSTAPVPALYIEMLMPGLLDTVLDLMETGANTNVIAYAEVLCCGHFVYSLCGPIDDFDMFTG